MRLKWCTGRNPSDSECAGPRDTVDYAQLKEQTRKEWRDAKNRKYRVDPEYREKRKANAKEYYYKNRKKRLAQMVERRKRIRDDAG